MVATIMVMGYLGLMAALGHGHLSAREIATMAAVGGVVTIGAFALTVRWMERWAYGPVLERGRDVNPWRTRAASIGLVGAAILLTPPIVREYQFRANLRAAAERHSLKLGDTVTDTARSQALKDLGRTHRLQALTVILKAADDSDASADVQIAAMSALLGLEGGRARVLEYTRHSKPGLRVAATIALISVADDPAAWSAIAAVARSDPNGAARHEVADYLATSNDVPASRSPEALALIRSLARDSDARVAIAAARGLSVFHSDKSGVQRVMAVVQNPAESDDVRIEAMVALGTIKDPRAAPVLWKILGMQYEPGFIPLEMEDRYRGVADEALVHLEGIDDAGYPRGLFNNESITRTEIEMIIRAETAAFGATRRFDPSLAPDGERNGYTRRFILGSDGFAYVATPENWRKTGVRGFCGDATARICFTRDGIAPHVVDGRCPESDQPIITPDASGSSIRIAPARECRMPTR